MPAGLDRNTAVLFHHVLSGHLGDTGTDDGTVGKDHDDLVVYLNVGIGIADSRCHEVLVLPDEGSRIRVEDDISLAHDLGDAQGTLHTDDEPPSHAEVEPLGGDDGTVAEDLLHPVDGGALVHDGDVPLGQHRITASLSEALVSHLPCFVEIVIEGGPGIRGRGQFGLRRGGTAYRTLFGFHDREVALEAPPQMVPSQFRHCHKSAISVTYKYGCARETC